MVTLLSELIDVGEVTLLTTGESISIRPMYEETLLSIRNCAAENCSILIQWPADKDSTQENEEVCMNIAPGSELELELYGIVSSISTLTVQVLTGGPVEVVCSVPSKVLN